MQSFEVYVLTNQLGEAVHAEGSLGPSIGRTIAAFTLQGIFPYTFRERTRTQLKWRGRDENNPDEVRQMIIDVANYREVDRAGRALDDELDGKRHGRKEVNTERRQERRTPKSGTGRRRCN